MHDPVHVVHVVVVQVVGRIDGDDRLQGRGIAHRHVDRVEPSPRDAEHPHVAVGERLGGQPRDDLLAVPLLDLAVLVGNERPLAVAGSPDVHARHDVPVADEIVVQADASAARLRLAVRQILEQHRERPRSRVGAPEIARQLARRPSSGSGLPGSGPRAGPRRTAARKGRPERLVSSFLLVGQDRQHDAGRMSGVVVDRQFRGARFGRRRLGFSRLEVAREVRHEAAG